MSRLFDQAKTRCYPENCANAMKLAEYLARHPNVSWVNYPGLADNTFRPRVDALLSGRAGGLLT